MPDNVHKLRCSMCETMEEVALLDGFWMAMGKPHNKLLGDENSDINYVIGELEPQCQCPRTFTVSDVM